MIEGLSLDLLGIGSGWAIVCLVVIMIIRGDLITRREARGWERQVNASQEREAVKDQTIAEFAEAVDTSNSLIRAVLNVAKEQSR